MITVKTAEGGKQVNTSVVLTVIGLEETLW